MTKPFYYTEKDKKVVIYGPFASERETARAGLFARSNAELNRACKARIPIDSYLHQGVSFYDEEELKALTEDPGAFRYDSVKIKPASALKLHSDWRGRDLEFLEKYYFGES